MVSFFGLKLGGDKKKKSGQTKDHRESHRDSQSRKNIDQNTLGADHSLGNDLAYPGTYAASIYSTSSRPGSSYSTYKLKKSAGQKPSVHTNETHHLASLSFYDIGSRPATSYAPGFSKSTTNLNSQWNGSSTNLGAPPVLGSRRPSVSSVKSARQKAWVNPLDIHFGKGDSSASAVVQPTQGLRPSPLAKKETLAAPPLPTAPALPARSPLRNPPSPPRSISRSIRTTQELDSCFGLAKPVETSTRDARPASPVSKRNTTKDNEARPLYPGVFGSSSLPSPPLSASRTSEDASRASASTLSEPVIQNVRAKHETMTVGAPRQRSLKMKVERPIKVNSALPPPRPKTSGGYESRRTDRRPGTFNLDLPSQSLDSGPRSPTFGRAQVPMDLGYERFNTMDRSSKSDSKDCRRQSRHHYTHSAVRASYSSSVYDSPPQSPESPVIPLSGPLASPRPPLPKAELPRHPSEVSEYEYDLPDWSALAEDGPQSTTNWPLSSQQTPQLPDPRLDSPSASRLSAGRGPGPTRDPARQSRRRRSRSRRAYARNHRLKQYQSTVFEIRPLWATISAPDSSSEASPHYALLIRGTP
ncbi:hypothetical protein PG994_007690 [Apiospora phragmitis]|uniref:Uncharacterized protein n=1 Tax=Apiospora phragmitis TaxID=2905665 RepID=A0ABR1UU23_9PEZI